MIALATNARCAFVGLDPKSFINRSVDLFMSRFRPLSVKAPVSSFSFNN